MASLKRAPDGRADLHLIDPRRREGVRDLRPNARDPVTEVPVNAERVPVGIRRGGRIKVD